jgi:hypothetical protein
VLIDAGNTTPAAAKGLLAEVSILAERSASPKAPA